MKWFNEETVLQMLKDIEKKPIDLECVKEVNGRLVPCLRSGIQIIPPKIEDYPHIEIPDKGNLGKLGEDFPNWHTGTPTEEGWYLIAFNYEFEEGVRYTTDYFKDGKWAFPMVRDISKLRAWQKIESYKEKEDGR